jgi:hypothetical protein
MPERQPGKEEWANSNQDMVDQPQPRRPRENRRQPETATRDWSDEDEETSRERTPKVYFNKPQRPGMGTLQPQISTSWTGRDDQLLYGSPPNVSALQTKTSSSESVLTVRQGNLGSQWPKTQDNDLNLFTSPEHGGMLVEPKIPDQVHRGLIRSYFAIHSRFERIFKIHFTSYQFFVIFATAPEQSKWATYESRSAGYITVRRPVWFTSGPPQSRRDHRYAER